MARIKKVPKGNDHHRYPVQKSGDTEEEGSPAERNDDEESKVTNETGDNEENTGVTDHHGEESETAPSGFPFQTDEYEDMIEPLEFNDDELQSEKFSPEILTPRAGQSRPPPPSRQNIGFTDFDSIDKDQKTTEGKSNIPSEIAEAERKRFSASGEPKRRDKKVFPRKRSASEDGNTNKKIARSEEFGKEDSECDRKPAAIPTKSKQKEFGTEDEIKDDKMDIDPFEQLVNLGTKKKSEIAEHQDGLEEGKDIEYLITQAQRMNKKRFDEYMAETNLTYKQKMDLGFFALYIKRIKETLTKFDSQKEKGEIPQNSILHDSPIWSNSKETSATLEAIQSVNILFVDHARYELWKLEKNDKNLDLLAVYLSKLRDRPL